VPRSKSNKQNVRLSVTLDEGEYAELTRMGEELDLSAAWMIRRAVSEFVARHRGGIAADLPLQTPEMEAAVQRKTGGSSGK
jgi:16S rRNA U516 pseudouridylate synthase RsuA-like enzyme